MPLYPVPSPLPYAKPGTVISARPFASGSALTNAASNTLVVYHTASATGRDVAVSGVISIPRGKPPAAGWPVISWAHGTTGNAPQCAPSRFATPDVEQRFLARTVYPQIGERWVAMGHSEGGTIALFAAALAPAWAPDLRLLGAVSYAPAADITDVLGHIMTSSQPMRGLPLGMMMVEGIASTDPAIDLNRILSPRGLALLPQLQTACAGELMHSPTWNAVAPNSLFQHNAPVDRLIHDFAANEPLNLPIRVPLLLEQGTADELVSPDLTSALHANLCASGVPAELDTIAGANHDSVIARTRDSVKEWVAARFADARFARQACK